MELIFIEDVYKKYNLPESFATIGMFDGVHLGHKKLINELICSSKNEKKSSMLITFREHPDYVLNKRNNNGYLTEFDEKIKLLESEDIDYVVVFTFSDSFSKISHEDFEDILIDNLNIKKMIVGSDTKYGAYGKGNINTLKEKMDVDVIEDYIDEGEVVHSKSIRKLFEVGLVEKANRYLGRTFSIIGTVVKGSKIGRTYNIKTANIELNGKYSFLKKGVYGVKVIIDGKKYLGIANIGNNPSFNYVEEKRLEVNIFDFSSDIYNNKIEVEFYTFVREEKVFSGKEELYNQIKEDVEIVKERIGEII